MTCIFILDFTASIKKVDLNTKKEDYELVNTKILTFYKELHLVIITYLLINDEKYPRMKKGFYSQQFYQYFSIYIIFVRCYMIILLILIFHLNINGKSIKYFMLLLCLSIYVSVSIPDK